MHMIGFTGSRLDRQDHIRLDPPALDAALGDPAARALRLDGLDPVLGDDGMLIWDPLPRWINRDDWLFLGRHDGAPHFARLHTEPGPVRQSPPSFPLLALLPQDQAAIWGAAKSVIDWHVRHRFCAVCGSESGVFRAGWGRRCGRCGAEHYPRVDPVAIMLAVRGDRALVGRQPRFPPGFYSALAGFMEPGESIEEAVRREIFEEAGIRCGSVRYIASQPWPFPSSLMIACIADAENEDIVLDTNELEHAFWVEREVVREAFDPACPAPQFHIPPPQAIAHHLLRTWALGDGTCNSFVPVT